MSLFSEARPLRDILSQNIELPWDTWLYIPAGVTKITLDTPCYARSFDARDLSEEELDEFDATSNG